MRPVWVGAREADKGLECLPEAGGLDPRRGCGARHRPRPRPTARLPGVGSLVTSKNGDRQAVLGAIAWGVYLASLDPEAKAPTLAGAAGRHLENPGPRRPPGQGVQALSPGAGATVAGRGQKCW